MEDTVVKKERSAVELDALVRKARRGDRGAQDGLVRAIQDPIYGLALRMLADPAAAEDATQEILIKVLTRLESFRGDSRFLTWVHAVAANHLRNLHARGQQRRWTTLDEGQEPWLEQAAPATERIVMTRELRLQYLHGLLVCLDRDQRLAFVLGEVLELTGVEASQILGITPATFRKRLSRARQRMRALFSSPLGFARSSLLVQTLPAYRTSDHLMNDLAHVMGAEYAAAEAA
jgi:RNA polymerase sigma factor (sigma-70 family)